MDDKGETPACVVCRARGKAAREIPNRMSRVTIEARTLTLCREHAGLVAIRMPKTWEELREIFTAPAPSERRSPVPRRHEFDDRRVLPPRPEGRRAGFGRRGGDPLD